MLLDVADPPLHRLLVDEDAQVRVLERLVHWTRGTESEVGGVSSAVSLPEGLRESVWMGGWG